MFNLIWAMLHNTTTDRWHPILFYESPLPGPPQPGKPIRHRSKGHHTEGLDTREEALASIEADTLKLAENYGPVRKCVDKAFEWDGNDLPAMVVYFAEQDGQLVPALVG